MQWLDEHNISKDQYYYWRKKLKDACIGSMQSSFVEIPVPIANEKKSIEEKKDTQLKRDSSVAASIRIGSISIDVQENASTDFIKKLIEAINYA